ncbi:serine/threonine-protein kinase [Catellatospora methionotrophica]|nr:serine/threonine-protein kinase [Catellatospora methionotrophica]
MPAVPPRVLADRYRLLESLGQGGMGMVWLARDETLHRDVAVKEVVPPAGLTEDERAEMNARSLREARAIARLSHPNVVRIFDVVTVDGRPWIVMEYLTGKSMAALMTEQGRLAPARVAEIGLGVLGALRAAHDAGMLHRDVKPGNVMLGDDGRVVLTDFGLATLPGDPAVTRTGLILGSPSYISPERVEGGEVGPAADLWSLGATLYAAVEGQSPYARPNAMATLAALATEEPAPPRLAGPLKPLLAGLLRKDPRQRMGAAEAEKLLLKVAGRRGGTGLFAGVRPGGVPGQRRTAAPPALPAPAAAVAAAVPAAERPARTMPDPQRPAEPKPPTADTPAASASGPPNTPPPAAPKAKAAAPAQRTGSADRAVGSAAIPPRADGALVARPGKRRLMALLAGAAVVVAVLAVVIVPRLGGGGKQRGDAAAGNSPSASASPSAAAASPSTQPSPSPSLSPAGLVLPTGWHLYRDRTGFAVAVPRTWKVTRDGTIVRFKEPSGGRLLLIDQSDSPKKDPVADWTRQEARRVAAGDWNDYRKVHIVKVDYFIACADWEFTYQGNSGRVHVINRGFVTGPKQAHAIYWSTPDSQWQDNLDEFALITASFQPNPV